MELLNTTLKLNSSSKSISYVPEYIDEIRSNSFAFINDDTYGNILIALTEAINNAVIHGNKNNKDKSVFISYIQDSNSSISFRIEDEGEGFDYNNVPNPTLNGNLETIGGRGVFLMQNLADETTYSNNGSIVELVFKIN